MSKRPRSVDVIQGFRDRLSVEEIQAFEAAVTERVLSDRTRMAATAAAETLTSLTAALAVSSDGDGTMLVLAAVTAIARIVMMVANGRIAARGVKIASLGVMLFMAQPSCAALGPVSYEPCDCGADWVQTSSSVKSPCVRIVYDRLYGGGSRNDE
jgi:hypothetical protein